ncbi:MAG TPA: ABC transporter permease, partial [Candidatus Hydrogenedentes bacterium]|nr:ABC transporter permease [Candidatus Hydrogenedentota bacterium]
MNEHRALLMLAALFAYLSAFAPNFLSLHNVSTILKGASLNATVALGFTIILILGQLDLSIGAVVMLSGMLTIGLQPSCGWAGAFAIALGAGLLTGLFN